MKSKQVLVNVEKVKEVIEIHSEIVWKSETEGQKNWRGSIKGGTEKYKRLT